MSINNVEVGKMAKGVNLRKKRLTLLIFCQRKVIFLKKKLQILLSNCRPYLAPKYWIIYAAAFGLGFYLWGPAHGFVMIKKWKPFEANQEVKMTTIETLQHEIEQLKKEIDMQKLQEQENIVNFTPDNFSRPAFGEIIQGFEWVNVNNTWRLHSGIDIETVPGSSIMASAEGVVKDVFELLGEGFTVKLEHGNDWESVYANLDQVNVKKGERIIKGTIIGTSGAKCCNSEKPGFHFGIIHNRQPIDPKKIIMGLNLHQ